MKGKTIVIAAIITVGVALLVMNMGGEKKPTALPVEVGFDAPDITIMSLKGEPWQLSSKRGNVVLINFWATWCDTCKEEMPALQKLYDIKKDDPGFMVVTVLYNDSPQAAADYFNKNGFSLPVYIDPGGRAAESYGLTGVPETYIVGKKGVLRKKVIGPADFDNPDAIAYFTRLVNEDSEPK